MERIDFEADGRPCRAALTSLETVEQSQRFARAVMDVTCPAAIRDFALDYDLFYDLDPRHIGFVAVDGASARLSAPDDTRLVWHLGGDAPSGLLGFVESGVEHILYGLDHILFLLSLLLMAVITRAGPGQTQATVRPGARRARLRRHHRHLLHRRALDHAHRRGAGMDRAARPPGRERHRRLDPLRRGRQRRAAGSAAPLRHHLPVRAGARPRLRVDAAAALPPEDVVLPLLAFNLGVELGQLGIVLVALPLLFALTRAIGAARYRRTVLPIAAFLLGGLAFIWLLERALDIRILGL